MKKIIKKTLRVLLTPFVLKDYISFKKRDDSRFSLLLSDFYPQIKDKTIATSFDRHYVYHTSWAARVLKRINPIKHIDISSSLYFSGIVSAFIPIDFYDYRPANIGLSDLSSKHGDLMNLPFKSESIPSLSCMHTIEHIGLGRYGDPIDPRGDLKAIAELKRVLAKDGSLLFVTPVGKPKIEFNAHRIYSYEQILNYFEGLQLIEFSLIKDTGEFLTNANSADVQEQNYACGCFWFKKTP